MIPNVVLSVQKFQRQYIDLLTEDIAEENMANQPGGIVNHPAWQLGHLVVAQDNLIQMLAGESKVSPEFKAKFESKSVPTADRLAYPTRAELLRMLDEREAEFSRLFSRMSSDDLAKPPPPPIGADRFPTMGIFLTFVATTHAGTHLGQLAAWRKAMGMSRALQKIGR